MELSRYLLPEIIYSVSQISSLFLCFSDSASANKLPPHFTVELFLVKHDANIHHRPERRSSKEPCHDAEMCPLWR